MIRIRVNERDFRGAGQVLLLDPGRGYKSVYLIINNSLIHDLFCLGFCICIFCFDKNLFQNGKETHTFEIIPFFPSSIFCLNHITC